MSTKKQTPEEIDANKFLQKAPERQRMSAIILLYISNMLTDFQLNRNFKYQSPKERELWLSLREMLNLPVEVTEDTVTLK